MYTPEYEDVVLGSLPFATLESTYFAHSEAPKEVRLSAKISHTDGGVYPGKIFTGMIGQEGYFLCGQDVVHKLGSSSHQVTLLKKPPSDVIVTWRQGEPYSAPCNAVIGGHLPDGTPHYIIRVDVGSEYAIGYFDKREAVARFEFYGPREWPHFEILTFEKGTNSTRFFKFIQMKVHLG